MQANAQLAILTSALACAKEDASCSQAALAELREQLARSMDMSKAAAGEISALTARASAAERQVAELSAANSIHAEGNSTCACCRALLLIVHNYR